MENEGTTTNSNYGFCPECGKPGVTRERRINGNDKCGNGHTYPSSSAVKTGKVVEIGNIDTLFYIPHSTNPGGFKGVGDNSSGVVVFENQEDDSNVVEVRSMPNSFLNKIKLKELCIAWLALNYPDVLKFDD